jgi:hypothetical protein
MRMIRFVQCNRWQNSCLAQSRLSNRVLKSFNDGVASLCFVPEPEAASHEAGYEDNRNYQGHLDIIDHT